MSLVVPGPGRVSLVLLAVVPAGMAYPWHTLPQRWALGVAVGVIILLFGWWRGLHLTTAVRRRIGLLLPGRHRDRRAYPVLEVTGADARTTVVLRVIDGGGRDIPFDLIAGYLDRYGVRCESVRVTSRDIPFDLIAGYLDRYGVRCESVRVTSRDTATGRASWIGLTMSAASNLPALQARSTDIPLRRTAELTARRLADQLREFGWVVTGTDLDIPDLLGPRPREGWRAVADGSSGYVAAYSIGSDALAETLTALWSGGFDELWTAIELSGRGVAAACAIRTEQLPAPRAPLDGLTVRAGAQWAALCALVPESTAPLDAEVCAVAGRPAVRWKADGVAVRT